MNYDEARRVLADPGTRDAVRVILKANAKRDALDATRDVLMASEILTARLAEFDEQASQGNPKLDAVATRWRLLLTGQALAHEPDAYCQACNDGPYLASEEGDCLSCGEPFTAEN